MKKSEKCLACSNWFDLSDVRQKYCSAACKRLQSYRRYYATHKEAYTQRRAEWRAKNPLRTKYLYAKADIKRRGRGGLHISYEDCLRLWAAGCFYCGTDVRIEKGVALDRIDNNKGYTLDNVLTCCGNCNAIRNDRLSVDEMKVAMAAVLKFRENICKIDSKIS